MSGKNEKSTFLTESSNIDDQRINENGERRHTAKTDEQSIRESSANDGEEETYSDNEMNNENPDEDEDEDEDEDDDFNPDAYPNPFLQQFSQMANSNIIKEEQEDDIVQYEENLRPLSALAPRVMHQDEAQVEVSSTPAFQCLEELFQKGKLTGTQVAQLKAKYIELHSTLKKSRENEARLLKDSKDYLKKLDENREILQKADAFPDNLTSEVLKLRAQFLKYENDASCSEERLYNLEYKQSGLEDDKQLLDREYSRMPKPHELERRIEQLKLQNIELAKEISQRQEEIQDLKQSINDKNLLLDLKRKEHKELLETVEMYKNDYVQVNMLPNQINKECDKLNHEVEDINKELARFEQELKNAQNELNHAEELKKEAEGRKEDTTDHVNKEKNQNFDREKEFNDLTKQYELEKEKEVVLQSDKVTLELSLRHSLADKKMEYDCYVKAQKDKERDSKNLKKLELQLKAAQDSLSNIRLQYEKIMIQKEADLDTADGNLFEKRKEITKEVEHLKRNLTQQQSKTLIEKVKVEKCIELEEHLLCEQSDCRVQAVEVTRLAAIKADEKEQKAREYMKAETRYRRAVEDLKIKENLIEEHSKRHRELKYKLKDFAKMYDIIKNERNKLVNQIQICTQRAAQKKEKIKILSNEIEILRTSSAQKEKRLTKQRLKHANAVSLRDSIRNEVEKQKDKEKEMKDLMEQQKMDINNYNNIINASEQESTRLRKRYDACVKERNKRGIELITRSEEVCVMCERSNCQENIITNANMELGAREEEIRFLKLRLEEDKRVLGLYRKEVPNEKALKTELDSLRSQLRKCQNNLIELEHKVENCNNPDRIRFLEGAEETTEDIMKKLEKLEMKLAKVEEQCLEKDLILEQVQRLTDRINNKVDSSKDDTLTLAKKVNSIQSQIKDTTKKMMATVSELSISQANALSLQESVKNKELILEQCYTRMEKGEPPSEDIEREWNRMMEAEEKLRDKSRNQMVEQEKTIFTLPDGYVTTAEPRPNAYIPQTMNELPLPKPYGRLAPFKPQEPGSSMRHIKKPNPKPIEI